MVSFAKYVADPQDELPSITYWLLGNLKNMSWPLLLSGAGWILAGIVILVLFRWKLDALMLSEEEVKSFGISVHGFRFLTVAASSTITAAVVSMCGQIGWIGLLIPHFCRMIYGGSNKDVIFVFDSIWCIVFCLLRTQRRAVLQRQKFRQRSLQV